MDMQKAKIEGWLEHNGESSVGASHIWKGLHVNSWTGIRTAVRISSSRENLCSSISGRGSAQHLQTWPHRSRTLECVTRKGTDRSQSHALHFLKKSPWCFPWTAESSVAKKRLSKFSQPLLSVKSRQGVWVESPLNRPVPHLNSALTAWDGEKEAGSLWSICGVSLCASCFRLKHRDWNILRDAASYICLAFPAPGS